MRVSAIDQDEGMNGELTYKIISGSRGKFNIEGKINKYSPKKYFSNAKKIN